jgi:hypothetical protein
MPTLTDTRIPPLEAGDVLTRDEFLRRWEASPDIKLAELIRGIVYMPSPVGLDHGVKDSRVATWLGTYQAYTPGTESAVNTTVVLSDDVPQPDGFLRLTEEFGGATQAAGTLLTGAPELVAEVAGTSAAMDLHHKMEVYEEAGVGEYLVILLFDQEVRWHRLQEGRFVELAPQTDGIWQSRLFPGLWLDGKAMLEGRMSDVLTKLHEGLASVEHSEFVAALELRRTQT